MGRPGGFAARRWPVFIVVWMIWLGGLLTAATAFPAAGPPAADLLGPGIAACYGLFLDGRHREQQDAGAHAAGSAAKPGDAGSRKMTRILIGAIAALTTAGVVCIRTLLAVNILLLFGFKSMFRYGIPAARSRSQ